MLLVQDQVPWILGLPFPSVLLLVLSLFAPIYSLPGLAFGLIKAPLVRRRLEVSPRCYKTQVPCIKARQL